MTSRKALQDVANSLSAMAVTNGSAPDLEILAAMPDGAVHFDLIAASANHSETSVALELTARLANWLRARLETLSIPITGLRSATVEARYRTDRVPTNRAKIVSFDWRAEAVLRTHDREYRGRVAKNHVWHTRPRAIVVPFRALMIGAEARALAYALETGAVAMPQVRDWADARIRESDSPEGELLDLATEAQPASAISLLHVLGRVADPPRVGRLVYAYLLEALSSGKLSHEAAARAVIRLALDRSAPCPDAEKESAYFDDAFDLARSGISRTLSEVEADLREHLERYADR